VLRQNHDDIGHPGIWKAYLSIASRYYIRRLSHRVRQHVNNCVVCQTSKPSNERMLGKLYPIETPEPNHKLSLDFITGLPLSERNIRREEISFIETSRATIRALFAPFYSLGVVCLYFS